ncbi:hypothetical protein MSG28_014633 [Choristoneura fumiferana]|uniref:Uncharacterized protein n=1 Tax=Choristoneura fumiferana TaxID=7141 RepID=A0ACC0JSI4_CHOFU|nr:hypothetical protein MSG28_014633 [Choristoneura fumiferana]
MANGFKSVGCLLEEPVIYVYFPGAGCVDAGAGGQGCARAVTPPVQYGCVQQRPAARVADIGGARGA